MDLDDIKALIDAMQSSGLGEMQATKAGWTLQMVRQNDTSSQASARVSEAFSDSLTQAEALASPDLLAPLSGIVHLRPAPDAPTFVVEGQAVKVGDPLCIIEAMKVFNEIRTERAGVIGAILVASGAEVDAGQILMRLA